MGDGTRTDAVLLKVTDAVSESLAIQSFGHALAGAAIIGIASTVVRMVIDA